MPINKEDVMKKKVKMSMLNELYGNMLTDKQRQCIDDYYNNDLSLTEIAQNNNITRQGVRDIIKKGEKKLLMYEEKLAYMNKTLKQKKKIEKILVELTKIENNYTDEQVSKILENMKKELNCLI